MGVHTGDSITVAPQQTLTDVEYQQMRDSAIACIRRVGVETGGSNVQFAVEPVDRTAGHHRDEPARVAVLGAGVESDRLPDRQDRRQARRRLHARRNPQRHHPSATPASFEPSIDYVVTKIPRWAFEKLPGTTGILGTQMQSVGEAMAIGRTFPESLQKALRSLEQGRIGPQLRPGRAPAHGARRRRALAQIAVATPERIFQIGELLRRGVSIETSTTRAASIPGSSIRWRSSSRSGPRSTRSGSTRCTRARLAAGQAPRVLRCSARVPVGHRRAHGACRPRGAGVLPTYKTVDTCAAEFDAATPYHYSTYEDESEVRPSDRPQGRDPRIGAEPHRAGDRVRLLLRARQLRAPRRGLRDGDDQLQPRDGVDRLRHQRPAVLRTAHREDVLNVIAAETAVTGVIVSLGGQTPLKLAGQIPAELVAGTSPDVDRRRRGPREAGTCSAPSCSSRSRLAAPRPTSSRRW